MSRESLENKVRKTLRKTTQLVLPALTAATIACGGGGDNCQANPTAPGCNNNGGGGNPSVESVETSPNQLSDIETNQDQDYSGESKATLSDGSKEDPDSTITFLTTNDERNKVDKFGQQQNWQGTIPANMIKEGENCLEAVAHASSERDTAQACFNAQQPSPELTYTLSPDSIAEGDTARHEVSATDDAQVDSVFIDTNGDGTFNIRIKGSKADTTLTYDEPGNLETTAKAQDNQGAESKEKTQTLQITDTPELTVNVKGASPQPGTGLVDIVDALVIAQKNGEADTARTNTSGQAILKNLEDGEYTLVVRDETNPDTIGTWYDIANPNNPVTIQVNEDTNHTVGLFPHVPLAPGDTAYQNNLDWFNKVVGNLYVVARGMPNNGKDPYRIWIHPDSLDTQEEADSVKKGILTWNGLNDEYDYARFVDDSIDSDYTLLMTDESATDRSERRIKVNETLDLKTILKHGAHEFSHVLMNQKEERSLQDLYCSQSGPTCPPGKATNLELGIFTSANILKQNFGENWDMDKYSQNN